MTNQHNTTGKQICCRLFTLCAVFMVCAVCAVSTVCFGQAANQGTNKDIPSHYTYVPRTLSKPGDYKVVVVPATNARQARLDAQTYHIGWDAIEARPGQSSVMYEVLLKKRPNYVPGTPPVTRRIPK